MSLPADFIAELRPRFHGDIRFDTASRILYSTDASIYQIEPLGVALPKTQEDLHAVVELAAKYLIPILPRGAGSSIAGQAIGNALILDMSRWLDSLIEINPEARTATVEPGLVLSRLNAAAARHGLTFGPDPASAERATLGGVIGNNATGAHSILYGMTADHLISADVVMADGSLETWREIARWENKTRVGGSLLAALLSAAVEIRENFAPAIQQTYPKSWRNSAGYRLNYLLPWSPSNPPQWSDDWSLAAGHYPPVRPEAINLAPLLAGSEGTLAVMRRATINLVPKPKHTILGVLAYHSIAEACDDVPRLLEFHPSAVELVPQMLIRLAKGVPAYASQVGWVQGDPAALLVVEFSGKDPRALKKEALRLHPGGEGGQFVLAESRQEQARVWSVRKVGLGIFDSRPADARPLAFIEDCAIPVEQLGVFVREVEHILAAHDTTAAFYAHASAGCLHIRPILDLRRSAGDLRAIAEATLALTLRLGGSMSSEHGDGIARAEFLRQTYGARVVEAMQLIKHAADPADLLNPGKMLDAPRMDTHLRYDAAHLSQPWKPVLDFGPNNGLAGAIEQCNGQGVCRKSDGVMCPSFQATREEVNSTRGRANLLRALIALPPAWGAGNYAEGEKAVFDALDLCLACKGCKSECPSGVDMAKLKYEFLHEYYAARRRKIRDYLFAFIGPLAGLGAPFARVINRGLGLGFARQMFNKMFGLSGKREFPRYGSQTLSRHVRNHPANPRETILLLRDTFTHYFEPEIEAAALKVLAAGGIEVKFLPYFGAGRTLLSKGFLEPARRHAERVLDAAHRLDPGGNLAVLGIEPSELYTLRDEFFDLLPARQEEVEKLAARAWLVEEFLLRKDASGTDRIFRVANNLKDGSLPKSGNNPKEAVKSLEKVLLHGHCYQKAQPPAADGLPVGQQASAAFLSAFGYEVETIPSGCCGMAGAFGYEAEHYDLSMQVGELALFPALRDRREGEVAAPGASCRAQIADGVGALAQHPLVLAAMRLDG